MARLPEAERRLLITRVYMNRLAPPPCGAGPCACRQPAILQRECEGQRAPGLHRLFAVDRCRNRRRGVPRLCGLGWIIHAGGHLLLEVLGWWSDLGRPAAGP